MSGPWPAVFSGYFKPGQANASTPTGRAVSQAMLGGNPSGPVPAHYAPFVPTGTSGQLAIGGTSVSSGANVTALYHSDYQGTLTLSTSARTNVLPRSLLEGAGTTPTGWTYYTDTGTSSPTSSAWAPGDGAQAWTITSTTGQNFIYQTFSVAANTVYCLSVLVESVTGSITAQNALYCDTFPAGSTLEFPVCSANPAGGNFGTVQAGLLVALLRVGSTAGSANVYVGVGCAASNTGTMKFSRPQIEAGTQRSSYIPTSATSASVTDYSYNDSGAVTLGQTATGAYSWSGSGVLTAGSLSASFTGTTGATGSASATSALALAPASTAGGTASLVATATRALAPAASSGGTGSPAATFSLGLAPAASSGGTGSAAAASSLALAFTGTTGGAGSPIADFSATAARNDIFTGATGLAGSPASTSSKALAPPAASGGTASASAAAARSLVPLASAGLLAAASALFTLALNVTGAAGGIGSPAADVSATSARNDSFTGTTGATGSPAAVAVRALVPTTSSGGTASASATSSRGLAPGATAGGAGASQAISSLALRPSASVGGVLSTQADASASNTLTTDPDWIARTGRVYLQAAASPDILGIPAAKVHAVAAQQDAFLATPARIYKVIL